MTEVNTNVVHAFFNKNLKMGKGKITGQVCHSVHYITKNLEIMKTQSKCPNICDRYDDWINNDCPIEIHEIPFDELLELKDYHESQTVIDLGRTQIPTNSMTVVGFYPNTLKGIYDNTDESNGDVITNTDLKNYHFDGDDEECAMYIFINVDLNMDTETTAQEAGKVTSYIIRILEKMKSECEICPIECKKYQKWETEGCTKIVLKATTEQLINLRLIPGSMYSIQKDTGVITTVSFYPNLKSEMRKYTTGYKLL
jgi:peptidyl-tRNA hydrolase